MIIFHQNHSYIKKPTKYLTVYVKLFKLFVSWKQQDLEIQIRNF